MTVRSSPRVVRPIDRTMRRIEGAKAAGATPCPACSGKGWLPIRLDALPIPGWTEMLCRVCSGKGKPPSGQSIGNRAEAA